MLARSALLQLVFFTLLTVVGVTHATPIILSSNAASPDLARRVLHVEPSDFSPVVVYETSFERCMTFMQVDNPDSETCYALADPQKMVFDYTRMMMSALFMKPDPDRILVIGLGGGTLTTALAALLPDAQIDSVEIDPAVLRVAETHFGFKRDDQKRVHIEDGRAFVEAARTRGDQYDLVLLDAFDSTYIPTHLMTERFLQSVRAIVTDDGVIAANTATASPSFAEESAAYASVFGSFYQLKADNRVILAMKRALPSTDTMKKNAAHWRDALLPYGITPEPFFEHLSRHGSTQH